MEQDFLKDITPPARKRTIRDIPIPTSRKGSESGRAINLKKIKVGESSERSKSRPVPSQDKTEPISENKQYYNEYLAHQSGEKKKKSKILPASIFTLILLGLFFSFNFFAYAKVTLYIKHASSEINDTVDIVQENEVVNQQQLVFREIPFSKELQKVITASGEEYISQKSSGVITVYNEYSTKPQNLLKNTRFESSAGKIYRIDKLVNIPGYTTVNGKKIPGSIDVQIFADATGDEFNAPKTDFTVPGFKGQEQYTLVYAKSKTDLTGGFEGTQKIVEPEVLTTTVDALQKELKDALVAEVTNQLPNNLVPVFDDTSFVINPFTTTDESDDDVRITVSGKILVKVIDRNKLSEKLAEVSIPDYVVGEKILVDDFSALDINVGSSTISVSGNAQFTWQIDEKAIKDSLRGISRNQVQSAFINVSGVTKIENRVMPIWKKVFPENVGRIEIIKVVSNN